MFGGRGPVTGRAQAGGQLAAPGTAGAGLSSNPDSLSSNPGALSSNLAGLTSNLTALDCNLLSRDDLLHDPWRQALLNELPGGLAARFGAIGRRHPLKGVKDLEVNPPVPVDEWAWVSRRALVAQSYGDDFRRNMVAAYIGMATQMPNNWLQCVIFTQQDTSVWSGLVGSVPAKIKDRRETTGFDIRYNATMAPPDKSRRDCTAVL
jgi:hypothetical protein